ncbi:hypothetical protein LINPERHAP2_LOCUS28956 [Linum perenne]
MLYLDICYTSLSRYASAVKQTPTACCHGHRRQPHQGQPHRQVRRQCLVTVQLRLRSPNGLRPPRLPLQLRRCPMRDLRLPGTDVRVWRIP